MFLRPYQNKSLHSARITLFMRTRVYNMCVRMCVLVCVHRDGIVSGLHWIVLESC